MNKKEIPGFYWDSEKKKYFQIQANHTAPAGSRYSQDAVKRRKIEEEHRQRRITIGRRIEKERVKRAISLKNPLIGLSNEIGGHPVPGFMISSQRGRVFASQVQPRGVSYFDKYEKGTSVVDFAREASSGILVVGANVGNDCRIILSPPTSDGNHRWSYGTQQIGAHSAFPYRLTSVSLHRSGHFLATMDSGVHGDSLIEVCRLPDESIGNTFPWVSHPLSHMQLNDDTFWTSAPNPYSDDPSFAIGTSSGLLTFEGNSGDWSITRRLAPAPRRRGRIMLANPEMDAVEWLSVNVIASGMRDSSIWLSDVRHNGMVKRLQHPHAVSEIRKVDDYRLVVAGCKSLQMYDLRFPLNGVQKQSRPYRSGEHTSTKPYMIFEDYESDILHKIALSKELGLLATATPEDQIKLYSIADGSVVPSPASQYQHPSGISRLKFEDCAYPATHDQAPRLMVSYGATIQEWTW